MLEMLAVYPVERGEIALHVGQENGDVHQVFPLCTLRLENGPDVGQNAPRLCLEVKVGEVAVVVLFQSGHTLVVGATSRNSGANTTQKQQIPDATGQGVHANGLGRGCGVTHGA